MAAREGNVLRLPGRTVGPEVKGDEILGSYARFTQKGLTLLKGTAGQVLEAGTLLKVSGTAKKYTGSTAAADAHVGVLRKGVDITTDMAANYVTSGIVKLSALKYANGTAVPSADYAAVAEALNGRIDPIHGYLIF